MIVSRRLLAESARETCKVHSRIDIVLYTFLFRPTFPRVPISPICLSLSAVARIFSYPKREHRRLREWKSTLFNFVVNVLTYIARQNKLYGGRLYRELKEKPSIVLGL